MEDIHQIKFTEKDDDEYEDDDDQKESEKCELIENTENSESLRFIAFCGWFLEYQWCEN